MEINVDVYSLKSPSVQQTLQFTITPLILELSPIWSHDVGLLVMIILLTFSIALLQ